MVQRQGAHSIGSGWRRARRLVAARTMVHAQPYTHTHRGETATRRRAHLHDNKAYDTVAVARIPPQPGLPPVFCSSQGYVCMMMTLCTPLLGSALATLRRMPARETNCVSDDALIKIIHWAGVNSVGRIQDPARHICRNLRWRREAVATLGVVCAPTPV